MELETAARKFLLTHDSVKGYVGPHGVFKYSLLEHVDGTGGRAIVVRRSGDWGDPYPRSSSEYPLLKLDFWADPDRVDGDKVADNAIDKAMAVYRVVNKLIHGTRGVMWGDLLVISASRTGEPIYETAAATHGGVKGAQGGVKDASTPIGDTAVVTATYAIHTAH